MNSAWDRHANVWFISSSSKNSLLNGMKILWDLKILWKTGSEGPKFSEILSHSVRYGMYEYISRDGSSLVARYEYIESCVAVH